jgi:hypothetical protein
MTILADGKTALDALYWRAEILQAMFWMRGEGIDTEVSPRGLAEFLAVETSLVEAQMADLSAEGFLRASHSSPLRYELTETGIAEGGRSFQDEFAELTHAAHYECAPGCWCHDPDHVGEPCPSTPAPKEPSLPRPDPPPPEPTEDRRGR